MRAGLARVQASESQHSDEENLSFLLSDLEQIRASLIRVQASES